MVTLFILILLIFFIIFIFKNYMKKFEDIEKLPGPSPLKLLQGLYFNTSQKGIITYLYSLTKIYGPVVKIWIKPFKPVIITKEMNYYNKLFKAGDHTESISFCNVTFMDYCVATNPNEDERKVDKQVITKAINTEYVEGKLNIYDKKYNELLDFIRNNLNTPIDMEKELHKVFMEILLETFFHPNVNICKEDLRNFVNNRNQYFVLLLEKMNSIRCMGALHKFTNNYRLMRKCHNEIIQFARNCLEKLAKVDDNIKDKSNLIYAMIDSGMSEKRIVGNLNALIEGGHDTSILPLVMSLKELAQHSEIQQKLLEEIISVIDSDISKEITLSDINKMPYLHAVVKEALRKYMPIPFLDRITHHDVVIGDTRIPKGIQVLVDFPGILRSEDNYDDPLTFKPERFLKDNVTVKTNAAFVAFGHGVKACPGKIIAYATMKLLIVKIIREFEIIDVDHNVEFVADLFFRSIGGIPVAFKKRTNLTNLC